MGFVKYIPAAANDSQWDVFGKYEVGMIEVDNKSDN
jgi:hypothetical protein